MPTRSAPFARALAACGHPSAPRDLEPITLRLIRRKGNKLQRLLALHHEHRSIKAECQERHAQSDFRIRLRLTRAGIA